MKQTIFEKAYKSKLDALKKGHLPESLVWDSLVFKKVRARLGGRVRLITSGAAPLQSEVHDFLRVCFCVPVLQGYGLTETTGGSVAQNQNDLTSGNTGTPFPCLGKIYIYIYNDYVSFYKLLIASAQNTSWLM